MGLKTPRNRNRRKPKKTKTLIVDGNVLMKRSYNGAKNVYHKDKHIGGIFAFYSTLRKLIIEHKIDKVVITWDGERGGTLRLDYYPEYKGNRANYFDKEYEIQKIRVKQYAEDLSIRQYEHPDVESDDLMAFYCLNKKKNEDVMIYTDVGNDFTYTHTSDEVNNPDATKRHPFPGKQGVFHPAHKGTNGS